MRHGGPDLDDILATCTRLKKLTLVNYGPEHGSLRRVRRAWLKDINIILCFPSAIELLWLPRLESFYLNGWFWTTDRLVSLGHVPRLTTITITGDIVDEDETIRLSRILANSTALTDLRLNFSGNNVSIVFILRMFLVVYIYTVCVWVYIVCVFPINFFCCFNLFVQIWVRPETSRRLTDAFSKLKNLNLKNVNRECGLA